MRVFVSGVLGAALLIWAASAGLATESASDPSQDRMTIAAAGLPASPKPAPDSLMTLVHGVFLGCVSSRHECSDIAHGRGYNRHWINFNHHQCGYEPHMTCWAE